MNNLEEYIKRNAGAFDDQELPEGHLERFEARLDAVGSGKVKRLSFRAVGIALTGIAAALAAFIFLHKPEDSHKDWFANVADDQESICEAYYSRMAKFYESILAEDYDGSKERQIEAIAAEGTPLVDQLPEELGETERAAILKEYYGSILDGIDKISRIK